MRTSGHYHEADSLYRAVVKEYPDDILADEALMDAAALNEKQLNDREAAKALYQELLDKYPASIFIPEARQRFRALRGDQNL
jgi:TolA-binding protein